MSTQQTAKTKYVTAANGARLAYRRLGTASGTPLVILTHFRGAMDKFDPLLVNTLALHRRIITLDYAGVGLSSGAVATTIRQVAADVLELLSLVGESEVDVLGFSLGGMVAQLVALNTNPAKLKVRKLILAGTAPSAGPGVQASPNADEVGVWGGAKDISVEAFKVLFFPRTEDGNEAADQWWARVHERTEFTSGEKPAGWLSDGYADGAAGLQAQVAQLEAWGGLEGSHGEEGSFERLATLNIPILVANGHDDFMVPTVNSWVMQQQLPNAQLIIYPKSGHGFCFQYASLFSSYVLLFLEA